MMVLMVILSRIPNTHALALPVIFDFILWHSVRYPGLSIFISWKPFGNGSRLILPLASVVYVSLLIQQVLMHIVETKHSAQSSAQAG
jgi:hypothetical protein